MKNPDPIKTVHDMTAAFKQTAKLLGEEARKLFLAFRSIITLMTEHIRDDAEKQLEKDLATMQTALDAQEARRDQQVGCVVSVSFFGFVIQPIYRYMLMMLCACSWYCSSFL